MIPSLYFGVFCFCFRPEKTPSALKPACFLPASLADVKKEDSTSYTPGQYSACHLGDRKGCRAFWEESFFCFYVCTPSPVINAAQAQITLTSDYFSVSMPKTQPIGICVFKPHSRGWSALCPQSGGKRLRLCRQITGLDEQREQALHSCRIFFTARAGSIKYDLQMEGRPNPIPSYACLISKLYAGALSTLRQTPPRVAHSSSSSQAFIAEMQFYKIALESSSLRDCIPVSSSKA